MNNVFTVLSLVFVVAKLFGHFPYSWWIVLAPSFVGFGIWLGALVAVVIAIVKER